MRSLGEIQFDNLVASILGGVVHLDQLRAARVTRDQVGPCEPTWALIELPLDSKFAVKILAHSEWGANDLLAQVKAEVARRRALGKGR